MEGGPDRSVVVGQSKSRETATAKYSVLHISVPILEGRKGKAGRKLMDMSRQRLNKPHLPALCTPPPPELSIDEGQKMQLWLPFYYFGMF